LLYGLDPDCTENLDCAGGIDLGEIQLLPAIIQSCCVAYCVGNVTSGGEPQPVRPHANKNEHITSWRDILWLNFLGKALVS
jgi:hypothetical protein